MFSRIAPIALIGAMLWHPANASAPTNWHVDATKSSLTFEVKVSGQTVTGRFPGFGSLIKFEPTNLAQSSVKITVDTTGIKTQDATRDAMLLKPAWFNVLDFPQAKFQSTSFVSTGPNKYLCKGKLTIKGVTREIDLPFNLIVKGSKAAMSGQANVKRLDFKIGEGPDFSSGSPVALSVKVIVNIQANKVK